MHAQLRELSLLIRYLYSEVMRGIPDWRFGSALSLPKRIPVVYLSVSLCYSGEIGKKQ